MWTPCAGRERIAAAAIVFALACGDDGPSGTTGSIQVAVNPAALSIPQGGTGSVTVTLTRGGGFSGAITLAITGLPAGITTTITPAQSSGTTASATVDVTVAATVAPGTYTASVTATAQGVAQATTTYQVTVTPAQVGGSVEYRFCDPSDLPVFFAYQDGGGPWQVVTGTTAGGVTKFAFNLTQTRGGVLSVFLSQVATRRSGLRDRLRPRALSPSAVGEVYQTYLLYASPAELAQDGLDACDQTPPTKTVTGTVAGVPAGSYGRVSLGGVTKIFDGAASTNPITFIDLPAGPVDLLGSRTVPGAAPDKVIVFRNLNIPDGGSLPSVIDFNGTASSAPATATVTITGAAGDDLEVYTDVVKDNRTQTLWADLSPSPATTRPWAGLGPATLLSGEFHELTVFASDPTSDDYRVSLKDVGPVTNQTIAFGPTINAPTVSQVVAGAYPRFRFQATLPAEYNKGVTIDVLSSAGSGNAFSILATGAYLTASGSALTYDITMPDVAGLAGFPGAARLTAGSNDVVASGFGFTGSGTFEPLPAPGREYKASTRNTTINVP